MKIRRYRVNPTKALRAVRLLELRGIQAAQDARAPYGNVLSVISDRDDIDLIVARGAPTALPIYPTENTDDL